MEEVADSMTLMNESRWKMMKKIDGGHSFWLSEDNRLAIADESADNNERLGMPHETDDGVLWVDRRRELWITFDEYVSGHIPLKYDDGTPTETIASFEELYWISDRYKWTANIFGYSYEIWRPAFRPEMTALLRQGVVIDDWHKYLDTWLYKPTTVDAMGRSLE